MSWQPGGVLLSRARLRFRAAEVSLDLLEAAVLGFRYAFWKYTRATTVRNAKRKKVPSPWIAPSRVRKEMVTTKLAPQLATVATLMAWPMMLTGYISLISSQKTSPRPMANDPV
jgi:hypothetical protein